MRSTFSKAVPNSADSFCSLGSFWEFIEEELSCEGMHKLRSDSVVVGMWSENACENFASPQHHRYVYLDFNLIKHLDANF